MYRSYHREREQERNTALRAWVWRTSRLLQGEAQRRAPRSTGLLAKSIQAFLSWPTSVVSVNVPYARFVEGYPVATRRHFVSWHRHPSMERWARRHGFDTRRKDGSVSKGGLWVWGYATKFFDQAIALVRVIAAADRPQA